MFAHGHDYKGALMDFTTIAGKIPMIPRYANGIWFTRWFDFNNVDVKKIVNGTDPGGRGDCSADVSCLG